MILAFYLRYKINSFHAQVLFLYLVIPTQVCSCEYCETFKNSFFIEHLQWLLPWRYNIKLLYLHATPESDKCVFVLFLFYLFTRSLSRKKAILKILLFLLLKYYWKIEFCVREKNNKIIADFYQHPQGNVFSKRNNVSLIILNLG